MASSRSTGWQCALLVSEPSWPTRRWWLRLEHCTALPCPAPPAANSVPAPIALRLAGPPPLPAC